MKHMKIKKKDIWLFALQLVVVASILLLSPLAVYLTTRDFQAAKTMAQLLWYHLQSPLILYFVNFYLFVPFLSWVFFKEQITWRKAGAIGVIMVGVIVFFV